MTSKELITELTSNDGVRVRAAAVEMWGRFCEANGFGYKFANRTAQKIVGVVKPDVPT